MLTINHYPFRHCIVDNYLDAQTVKRINETWPEDWTRKNGKTSVKNHTQSFSSEVRNVINAVDIGLVENATGLSGLFPDPELFGGGLHCIPRGGYLKMHVDFNQHPKGWRRRVNMLIYLNEVWDKSWGGNLRLGLEQAIEIEPIAGRCVIFETNCETWHGHPEPLKCPRDIQRRSIALYFYDDSPLPEKPHTTIYQAC